MTRTSRIKERRKIMTNAEIDRLVAEKVMEWKEVSIGDPPNDPDVFWLDEGSVIIPTDDDEIVWSPTTDPGHCRMVEDKLVETLYLVIKNEFTLKAHNEMRYSVTLRTEESLSSQGWSVMNPDRNLAICLAALQAHGVEVQE
jgi:hypothetical protein